MNNQRIISFGLKADTTAYPSDVRFTPESGHVRRISSCPLWANSGLMHCSNQCLA